MFHKITIRTNILTNFMIVVGLVAASLLGLQYYFSQKMALDATHKTFKKIAEKITLHIQAGDRLSKAMLYHTELYPGIADTISEKLPLETISRYAHNMQLNNNIYAIYVGHANGNFFEVVNMHSSTELHKVFKAPKNTRWMVIKIYNAPQGRIRSFDYLDETFTLIASRNEPSRYLANTRPWFTQATQSDKATRSDPYLFSNLGQKGITFSKTISDTGAVLAIDFTLLKLNALLRQQSFAPTSKIYMFGRDGSIIASSISDEEQVNAPLSNALKEGKADRMFSYDKDGKQIFAMVTTLSNELGSNTYLGFSVDADVMLRPYLEKILYSLGAALLFLVLSIPMILYATSRIAKPVKALMAENEKIRERRFDEVRPLETNIIELAELSDSLVSMSESIRAYQESQKELMDSFIKLIADAIDAKSSYTGGHCKRVPVIAMMLARVASDRNEGSFKDFRFESEDDWREFEIGAWLHDCGKITTPEYVVDKATKLETIYNRIHEIRSRFEMIWRDIEIEYYERIIKGEDKTALEEWKAQQHRDLLDDFAFIAESNIGGEYMSDEKKERIRSIAKHTWVRHFDDRLGLSDTELMRYAGVEKRPVPAVEQLLSDRPEHLIERVGFDADAYRKDGFKLEVPKYLCNYGEIYNLCIEKGTLTDDERFKINEHVIKSIKMLERLPYPEHMARIPEYAGTHHETMIGTGYPRRLTKDDLSVPARIMAIADIFEALTASDRPYKKGKTLSEAIKIMSFMKKEEHIDAELFELFLRSDIYKEYAKQYLKSEQIDEVDLEAYLG
ncbi:MAG: amino acid ABC transporter [Desulfobacterales bacterium S5133MH16]|nr:MAG: amino acid ABC transporter [Desulfobacterales bacterium S5133MH16]